MKNTFLIIENEYPEENINVDYLSFIIIEV